jgi:hypothetical protein
MRIRGSVAAACAAALAPSLWATGAAAKDRTPTVSVFEHPRPLYGVQYFKDSDIAVVHDYEAGIVLRSPDGGATWDAVSKVPEGDASRVILHEFDDKRAYIITNNAKHYRTTDRGESWDSFSSEIPTSEFQDDALRFHADDPDRIIFHGMQCEGRYCGERTMYTLDGFETIDTLRINTNGCWWARSSELFSTDDDDLDQDRTICILRDARTNALENQRLVVSDDFFERDGDDVQQYEPNLDMDRPVQGVISVAFVKKYLLVATISAGSDEMALFVTDDTIKWHRAMFPERGDHPIRHEAYTILESTDYSIQLDVMFSFPLNPMGVLYTSNSNGTYFTANTEYTNRNPDGGVDFEAISGIQGIFLVNSVENGPQVEEDYFSAKKIVSQITFDDGRTFEPIHAGDKRIHLHSYTELDNSGKVFSSPAPGLVMGNGNTGDELGEYTKANLYISDDAGVTWKQAPFKGAHKYEFGDQGSILLAVKDSFKEDVGEYSYSLNHGEDWTTVPFPDGIKIKPMLLTTTQMSAGLKFILLGRVHKNGPYNAISIDFSGLHEKECGDGDMEDWHARVDHEGKPTCVMGHKQTYRRRKKDANCFLNKPFTQPAPKSEPCECDDVDFECDFNFEKDDDGKCVPAVKLSIPDGKCADPKDTFKGPTGYRKIPGNQCKGGKDKEGTTDRSCEEAKGPSGPSSGKLKNSQKVLASGQDNLQKFYLERSDKSMGSDETIIARAYKYNSRGDAIPDSTVWRTKDHGKTWEEILEDEDVFDIFPHQYYSDTIFFTVEDSKRVIYTIDRGEHFHEFKAPLVADNWPLAFHPDHKDWLIWHGSKYERVDNNLVREAWISKSRGDKWDPLLPGAVDKCEFIGHSEYNFRSDKMVLCLAREGEDSDSVKNLIGSDDFFDEHEKVLASDVKNFATMSEFIVVAAEDDDGMGLKALTSIDGEDFAEAKFPANSIVPHENAYTVLDSSSHAIRLFVATETTEDHRFGNIVKSNSNGTSYVRIAEAVNCNNKYYVDFEKITGLEGVLSINVVVNKDQLNEEKVLRTQISHNDGAVWSFLPPPAADVDGKAYPCKSKNGDEKCALHLHHYTEREDKTKTFSVASAVGIMFGVGNVGPSLGPIQDADTFLTTDGGVTWKNVAKGHWTWQFGDQGSLLVLVRRYTGKNKVKTKTLLYSMDEGDTWEEHTFSDKEVEVLDVTSQRSGSSRNFMIWAKEGGDISAINVDFSGKYERACQNPRVDASDYYTWSPSHPSQNFCFNQFKRSQLINTTHLLQATFDYSYHDLQHMSPRSNALSTYPHPRCSHSHQHHPSTANTNNTSPTHLNLYPPILRCRSGRTRPSLYEPRRSCHCRDSVREALPYRIARPGRLGWLREHVRHRYYIACFQGPDNSQAAAHG